VTAEPHRCRVSHARSGHSIGGCARASCSPPRVPAIQASGRRPGPTCIRRSGAGRGRGRGRRRGGGGGLDRERAAEHGDVQLGHPGHSRGDRRGGATAPVQGAVTATDSLGVPRNARSDSSDATVTIARGGCGRRRGRGRGQCRSSRFRARWALGLRERRRCGGWIRASGSERRRPRGWRAARRARHGGRGARRARRSCGPTG